MSQLALAVSLQAGFQHFMQALETMHCGAPPDTWELRAIFYAGVVYGARGNAGRL